MALFSEKYKYPTTDTNLYVATANAHIDKIYAAEKWVSDSFFLAVVSFLSRVNLEQHNGGPFGAAIVAFDGGLDCNGKGIGKPRLIGVGTNHVVPNNDPSAHAEMEAFRDAARRQGSSDLKGTVLYTSCECCPMCLSIANGSGIARILYANTRAQAEEIGFSDRLQYDMFRLSRTQQMTSMDHLTPERRAHILKKLGAHGAVILDNRDEIFAHGDPETCKDPTSIASLNAVRNAVKNYARQRRQTGIAESIFYVPDDFTLVCKDIPHPAGLVAADWARMLRRHDPNDPQNPTKDEKIPDPQRVLHATHNYEALVVTDCHGQTHVHQDTRLTYQQPLLPDDARIVHTERCTKPLILKEAAAIFSLWKNGTRDGHQIKY
ncbi:MAG: nucleoside deaminase [Alphaproteobacteria bacterium]